MIAIGNNTFEHENTIEIGGKEYIAGVLDGSAEEVYSEATSIPAAFTYCTNLKSVYFPCARQLEGSNFAFNTQLEHVCAPRLSEVTTAAFMGAKIKEFALCAYNSNVAAKIQSLAFSSSAIEKLALTSDKLCVLEDINAFDSTKISNGNGYIYVTDSLYLQYKSDTNWDVYSDKISKMSNYVNTVYLHENARYARTNKVKCPCYSGFMLTVADENLFMWSGSGTQKPGIVRIGNVSQNFDGSSNMWIFNDEMKAQFLNKDTVDFKIELLG